MPAACRARRSVAYAYGSRGSRRTADGAGYIVTPSRWLATRRNGQRMQVRLPGSRHQERHCRRNVISNSDIGNMKGGRDTRVSMIVRNTV